MSNTLLESLIALLTALLAALTTQAPIPTTPHLTAAPQISKIVYEVPFNTATITSDGTIELAIPRDDMGYIGYSCLVRAPKTSELANIFALATSTTIYLATTTDYVAAEGTFAFYGHQMITNVSLFGDTQTPSRRFSISDRPASVPPAYMSNFFENISTYIWTTNRTRIEKACGPIPQTKLIIE